MILLFIDNKVALETLPKTSKTGEEIKEYTGDLKIISEGTDLSGEAATVNRDTEVESLKREWMIQAADEAEKGRPRPIPPAP